MAVTHNLSAKRRHRIRANLLARDGDICHWCGFPMARSDMTIDHLKPRSFVGRNRLEHLVLAHQLCNARRGLRRAR